MTKPLLHKTLVRLLCGLTTVALLAPLTTAVAQPSIQRAIVDDTVASDPSSAIGILRAVNDLMNVGEYDLANEFLQKFIDKKPNLKQRAKAHRTMGSPFFAKLIRTAQVNELGSQVTDLVLDAAEVTNRDPKQLEKLVNATMDDDEDARRNARSELRAIGSDAVPYILKALQRDDLKEEHPLRLQHALAGMGKSGVPAMIGALTSGKTVPVIEAASALRHFKSEDALLYLLRPYFLGGGAALDSMTNTEIRKYAGQAIYKNVRAMPTRNQATKMLRRTIDRLLNDPLAVKENLEGMAAVWMWDDEAEFVVRRTFPRSTAAWLQATLLADDLYQIAPDEAENRDLFLLTQLGWAKLRGGIEKALPAAELNRLARMSCLTPGELNFALETALEKKHIPAAVAASELFGHLGSGACKGCIQVNGNSKAITKAVTFRHPRVQFAATKAILQLDKTQPYEGACDVSKTLMRLASSNGARRVLIVHPNRTERDYLAGQLQKLGFVTTSIGNGKEGYRAARSLGDLELILVSDVVERPAASGLIQQLAYDHSTAHIPVCLLTRDDRLHLGEYHVQRYEHMDAFPFPRNAEGVGVILRRMLPLADEYSLSQRERLEYATWATEQMAALSSDPLRYGFYEPAEWSGTLIGSLSTSELSPASLRALGQIANADAQRTLVDFASQNYHSLELRSAAAESFSDAIERGGILLTTGEIQEQYDRYNENLESEQSAAVLSSIIDSIERPSRMER